jgi:hypothetical protein
LSDILRLSADQLSFVKNVLPEFPLENHTVDLAGQAGSMRRFLRIRDENGRSVVLVVWDGNDEDWPRYLAIPRELSPSIMVLPELYGSDKRLGLVLEEDLGDSTLKRYCLEHSTVAMEAMYRSVLDALCEWQNLGDQKSPTIAAREMDVETFLWETDYFARRCVVDFFSGEKVLGAAWENERLLLAQIAAKLQQTFIHRDFQSENIMLASGQIRFVDFQGARLGPPLYDVASLLIDPYIDALDNELVSRLFSYYAGLPLRIKPDERAFLICAAQRLMQALGAYGNLSMHQGKTRYREFVPVALKRLAGVMEKLPEFKVIGGVVGECLGIIRQ